MPKDKENFDNARITLSGEIMKPLMDFYKKCGVTVSDDQAEERASILAMAAYENIDLAKMTVE